MAQIKAIFSDFGGVLYKTPDYRWLMRLTRLFRRADDHDLLFGLYLSPSESPYVQAVMSGQIPEAEVWQALADRFGFSPTMLARMRATSYAPRRLNHPMIQLLKGLRPNYITAILTNAATEFRATFCQAFEIESWADEVIISAEIGMAKPDPAIYHAAAERMGVLPEESIFMDDMPENVAGAQAAGMHAFHFRSYQQAAAEINRLLNG